MKDHAQNSSEMIFIQVILGIIMIGVTTLQLSMVFANWVIFVANEQINFHS